MRQIVKVCFGLLMLAVVVGCGSRSKSGVVSGKVTYKSQPVGGAALLLYAAGNAAASPITIPVDDEGAFRITDVPQGEYKVVVQGTTGSSEVSEMDTNMKDLSAEQQAEMKQKLAQMNTPATMKFPDKYKDLKRTTLTCTVTDKNETLDFPLTD